MVSYVAKSSMKTLAYYATLDIDQLEHRLADFFNNNEVQSALRTSLDVRATETALLEAFGQGKVHGTLHTCIGQELIGSLVGGLMTKGDFVFSNHRGHGHFIGLTGNWRGLVDEILGNIDGVCAGVGGSQHLCTENFLSNGLQGGLLPVASGVAFDRKRQGSGGIAVSYIGDGTLGEGVLYETLNVSALWNLPHLIICENNFYSQTTCQSTALAGDILLRAAAFGWTTASLCTWEPHLLLRGVQQATLELRSGGPPQFLLVDTYRLAAHSKGDDLRSASELEAFRLRDPLNILLAISSRYRSYYAERLTEIKSYIAEGAVKPTLPAAGYYSAPFGESSSVQWKLVAPNHQHGRISQALNSFYRAFLGANPKAFLIGEDIQIHMGEHSRSH